MDRFTEENMDQAIIPATWDQLSREMPEAINALVMGMLGLEPQSHDAYPVWYVLTKASGVTGIPLATLYNDPQTRQHALATMAAELTAKQKVENYTRDSMNTRRADTARAVEEAHAQQMRGTIPSASPNGHAVDAGEPPKPGVQ